MAKEEHQLILITSDFLWWTKNKHHNIAPRVHETQSEIVKFAGEDAASKQFKLVSFMHEIWKIAKHYKKNILIRD